MANVVTDRPNFIEMLRQPGFWNNGIEGGVGIEVLSFVAQIIGQPILILTQEQNGNYRYWISGTREKPRDGNLTFYEIINYKNVDLIGGQHFLYSFYINHYIREYERDN